VYTSCVIGFRVALLMIFRLIIKKKKKKKNSLSNIGNLVSQSRWPTGLCRVMSLLVASLDLSFYIVFLKTHSGLGSRISIVLLGLLAMIFF
jgi:hypothetical protein